MFPKHSTFMSLLGCILLPFENSTRKTQHDSGAHRPIQDHTKLYSPYYKPSRPCYMSQLSLQYSSSLKTHVQEECMQIGSFCLAKYIIRNTTLLSSARLLGNSSYPICIVSLANCGQFRSMREPACQDH